MFEVMGRCPQLLTSRGLCSAGTALGRLCHFTSCGRSDIQCLLGMGLTAFKFFGGGRGVRVVVHGSDG